MKLIECPRDAMQGIKEWIPTEKKIEYIKSLLKVGFDTIDAGSFVSPRAVPQMQDTKAVFEALEKEAYDSKILAIVANTRGAQDASEVGLVDYLGYPFSISEEFQKRNTNASIDQSLSRVEEIQSICHSTGKELVIYISMAFGNPYGENWHPDIAIHWSKRLREELDVRIVALSDTIGVSGPDNIKFLFESLAPELKDVELGAHLHTTPEDWKEKVEAAYLAGCRRFDGALKGFGGCPMADDDLTGNMPTEKMIEYLSEHEDLGLNMEALQDSMIHASDVFSVVN
jgi:hydroxymethylglutaryl-CoA lyase